MMSDLDIKQKIELNKWEDNLPETFNEILRLLGSDWVWVKNGRCKYVNLTIDMRDGGFVLLDRHRNRISLDELKRQ